MRCCSMGGVATSRRRSMFASVEWIQAAFSVSGICGSLKTVGLGGGSRQPEKGWATQAWYAAQRVKW